MHTELETTVKEAAEERKGIKEMSQKALYTAENTEMRMQSLTYEVTQFQDKTDAEIKQQAEQISSMQQQLQETTSKLKCALNFIYYIICFCQNVIHCYCT